MSPRLDVGPAPQRRSHSRSRWIWASVVALLMLLLLRFVYVELVVVRGHTMAPAALDGDVLLVARRATPEIGDVVLVEQDGKTVLRRVLAGPGTRVTAVDGVLTLDDVPVETRVDGTFTYLEPGPDGRTHRQQRYLEQGALHQHPILGNHVGAALPWLLELPDLEVPPGHVFVLCDNRRACPLDERSGVVDVDWLQGVATHRVWAGDTHAEEDSQSGGWKALTPSGSGEGPEPPRK
jgi:signal peptidase I